MVGISPAVSVQEVEDVTLRAASTRRWWCAPARQPRRRKHSRETSERCATNAFCQKFPVYAAQDTYRSRKFPIIVNLLSIEYTESELVNNTT